MIAAVMRRRSGAARGLLAALALGIAVAAETGLAFDEMPAAAPGRVPGAASLLTGPAVRAAGRPEAVRDVAFEQKLDARVPLDVPFRDETGRTVTLADYAGARPALLQLAYYRCPMLCPIVLGGLVSSLKPLAFDAGRDFDVVTVSIDPTEGPEQALERKRDALSRYDRPGTEDGWHFLTGSDTSIRALTDAVGFRYARDEARQEYAHAAGIVLLTADGRVSRYFFGAEFSPRDLRLGMVEATDNQIGNAVDQLLLFCFHYDPAMGRYTPAAMTALRAAGALTVLVLASFIFFSVRRELRARAPGAERLAR
jgi:protein SCO1/2